MRSLNRTVLYRPGIVFAVIMYAVGGQAVAEERRVSQYDPMRLAKHDHAKPVDLDVQDVGRKREIPIRVYLPKEPKSSPVVLFSHGLGGSRTNNPYLGQHWSARGYAVVSMQHHGSDEAVWKGVSRRRRLASLKKAASLQNSVDRYQDVSVVLDQLETWNKKDGHVLSGKLDLDRVGMSGHSFGAITTQGVSGQSFPLIGQHYTDERIDAALAMSPSIPSRGDAKKAFARVSIPWMLMTGTHDTSIINGATAQSRKEVYASLRKDVERYGLVLHHAEHSAFSDRELPGDQLPRNPNHHRAIQALSTAFWDSYLKENNAAKTWLGGQGAKTVLETNDQWEFHATGSGAPPQ